MRKESVLIQGAGVPLVGMSDHYEEHPGTIQYKPAKENENKIQDKVVIMKPCFCFPEVHLGVYYFV